MAWTCHGTSNNAMVQALEEAGIIRDAHVKEAMLAVDRALFVPYKRNAYSDGPQPIGSGATISAPHMHGYCLELLKHHLTPGASVLDVGSGSGYLTAVFARMVCSGSEGRVVGVDHMPELVEGSRRAVQAIPWAKELMHTGQLKLETADGRMGAPEGAPYDAIHVGAAAAHVPDSLTRQLAPRGRLVVPVGPDGGTQHLVVVDKDEDGHLTAKSVMGVMYVPLTSRDSQLTRF